jgi:KDO2-lipid IV(A) lauroyltransferase
MRRTVSQPQPTSQNKRRSPVADYSVYLVARLFICVVQALPLSACARLSKFLAGVLHDRLKIRRQVIEDNLRHAFPESSDIERTTIAREMFEHLLLMICEIAHAPRKIHETNWRRHFRLVNPALMVRPMLEPRAVLAVTAHHGNFEMNGYAAGLLGFPTYTLARTLDNPYLQKFLSQFRGATGQHILPAKESSALATSVIEANETLAALADHYGGPKGCWIEFFQRPASCHKAIALFSLAQNAPMVICHTKRTTAPLQFELNFTAAFDPALATGDTMSVQQLTQWYSSNVESFVREAPGQYWWLHRRWKDTRDAYRQKRRRRTDTAESTPDRRTPETPTASPATNRDV